MTLLKMVYVLVGALMLSTVCWAGWALFKRDGQQYLWLTLTVVFIGLLSYEIISSSTKENK